MQFQDAIKNKGIEFQNKIQGILKKHGLNIEALDKNNKNRRPDFLAKTTNGEFIGECKGIYSDGFRNNCHVSTLDDNFEGGVDSHKMDLGKIETCLKDAKNQLEHLAKDSPGKYNTRPFVVFLHLDFFADDFNFIPKDLFGMTEISAIAKIERDIERYEMFQRWGSKKIKDFIDKKTKEKIPLESVRFRVLINPQAKNKFKANAFLRNPIIIK